MPPAEDERSPRMPCPRSHPFTPPKGFVHRNDSSVARTGRQCPAANSESLPAARLNSCALVRATRSNSEAGACAVVTNVGWRSKRSSELVKPCRPCWQCKERYRTTQETVSLSRLVCWVASCCWMAKQRDFPCWENFLSCSRGVLGSPALLKCLHACGQKGAVRLPATRQKNAD